MSRYTLSLILLLLFAASHASAQDWQWEQYEGTFWHSSDSIQTFEYSDGTSSRTTAGDFDGDGKDELIRVSQSAYFLWRISENGEWAFSEDENSFLGVPGYHPWNCASAYDLNNDGRDELLFYSPDVDTNLCWSLGSTDPWQWTLRNDLLDSLNYPAFPAYTIFGDFDGDSLLNGISIVLGEWGEVDSLVIYERLSDGSWIQESSSAFSFSMEPFIAADLDSDGDVDFGFVHFGIFCFCTDGTYFENVGGGAAPLLHQRSDQTVTQAGDFDGDGQTEGIVHNANDEFLYHARLEPGSNLFNVVVPNIYPANTSFVGWDRGNGGHRIFSYHNQLIYQEESWTWANASRYLTWSDSGWAATGPSQTLGHVLEGNESDIDGDMLPDILLRLLSGSPEDSSSDNERWMLEYSAQGQVHADRFTDNEDTVFVNPRIGDVEGDGMGELVVIVTEGAPIGLYFYEIFREDQHTTFVLQPQLSEGLSVAISEFTLGDIDNDSQAELVANVAGIWRAYFRRNGHWVTYPNILPTGIGSGVNLIDFDNDGDLDIISQNGVWLSLSPSPASDNSILHSSSFILSCYPNPFNPTTTIRFDLPVASRVVLDVFNIEGRKVTAVADRHYNAGTHALTFDGSALASGLYFARLQTNDHIATTKLMLVK